MKSTIARLRARVPEVAIVMVGFPLSLAWEFLQSPFYLDTFEQPWTRVAYNRIHCSVGDVMILLAAFWIVAWVWGRSWMSKFGTIPSIIFVLIGVVYTLLSEPYNVSIAQNWAYSEWMPAVGGIGLVPVFQWLLVPSLIIRLVRGGSGVPDNMREASVGQLLLTTVVAFLFFLAQEVSAQLFSSVPQVVAKVRPAVVQIRARQVSYDIFLRPVPSEGLGSGIIYDSRGHILTNSHVVGEEKDVQVILPDGRKFGGGVMGQDPITDLAVVMIKGKDLPYTPLGDSSKLEIGETLIAIGNALGLEGGPTVTVGVVSALNRSIEDASGIALSDLIQTDAAINPGNSGGPLINLKGEVVGINTAVIPSAHGLGFAIAINSAKPVAKELLEIGMIVRPWLGIAPITMTPGLAALYDLPAEEGVFLARVEKGSPAAQAGLQPGDIITALGGEKVKSVAELRVAIAKKKLGERVDLEINRNKKKFTASLTLGWMPNG